LKPNLTPFLPFWTLSDSSYAGNPGQVPLNPWRWLQYYPKWPLVWFSSLAAVVAMACFVDSNLWAAAGLLLVANWFYWQRVREHFRNGDACTAMIVSVRPMRIAVATDLSKGDGEYPVIKIIRKSLATACGQIPEVGSKLATVALYNDSGPAVPHWSDFDPRPIDCATANLEVMDRVMQSFAEKDWEQLYDGLRQVPQPYRCGLYHVEPMELEEELEELEEEQD
jgi:hypothetical protein